MHTVKLEIPNLDHDKPEESVAAFWGVVAVDRISLHYLAEDDHTGERKHIKFTPPADNTAEKLAAAVEALRSILAGSRPVGRWLDAEGSAIDGYDDEDEAPPADEFPDAEWEPYTAEEQSSWLQSIADTAEAAILAATKEG